MFNRIMQYLTNTNGTQTGDSDKAAAVLVDIVRGEGVMELKHENGEKTGELHSWPQTLFLGSDAVRDIRERCENVLESLKEWKDASTGIDIDD